MKKFQLLRFSLFTALALTVFACNNDDEPNPETAEPVEALAFDAQNPPIELPAAIQNSTSAEAAMINSFVASANVITSYSSYFDVPEGAEFSTTPITAANGRSAAMVDYKVYTWSASQGGMTTTVAYQLSETSTDLKFEIFIDQNGAGFYKILEGTESKAATRKGNLKWYAQELSNEPVFVYSWEDKADGSFNMTYEGQGYLLTFDVAADGAGVIEQSFDGDLYVQYTWNAAGTGGVVTYFDSEGNITETFDWTV